MIRYSSPSSLMSLPEYFPNRMRSPLLNIQRNHFAIFQALALSDGYNFALLGLFLGRVGDKQATDLGFLLLDPFDNDAVIERSNIHELNLLWCYFWRLASEIALAAVILAESIDE